MSVPSTVRVPSQRPSWANRWVLNMTVPRARTYWRGSSKGSTGAVQVTSMASRESAGRSGSTITRSLRSGSITSMRIGPTEMSERSVSGLLARTTRWSSPRVTAR